MVVSVTSPGHFWAHIRNENLPKLVNLQKNIDEFYSDSRHFQTYQCHEVAVDDVVAVCLSNQSQWYRARVTAVLNNSYKVFCVDYGYNEEVPKDNVCRLREEYLSLPYQAVECYLANIKPKDDHDWTRSACNAFENMVCMNQSKIISGEIVRYQPTSHGLVPCLQLIDYDGPQDSFVSLKPDLDSSRFGIQNGQDFHEESKFLLNPQQKNQNIKHGNDIHFLVTWCNLWLRAYTKRAAAKVLNSEGFGSTESLTDPFLKSPPTEETPISLPPANTGWADDFPWAWAYNEEESAPGKDVCEMQTRLSNIHSPTVEIQQPGAGDITSLQETNALTKKTSETSGLAEYSEDTDGNTASKAEEVSNGFFYNGICSDVDAGLVKATSDLNVDHVTNNDSLVESPSANENSKLKYLDRREEISPSSDYSTSEMFDSGLMSGDLSISTPISETSHEFDHESLDQSDLEYVAHSQSDVTRVEKPESGSGGALDLGVTQVSEDNYSTNICESSITVSRDDVSSGLDSLQGDQIRFSQEMSSLVIKDGSLLDQATLQATNTKESDPLSFQESSVSPILKQPLKIQSLDGEETEDYELEYTGEKLNSLGAKDVVSRRDTNVQKYEELKSSEKLIPVEADTNISLLDSDRTQKTTQEIVTSGEAEEASLQSTGKPEETKSSDTVDAQFSRSDLVTNVSSHTETSKDESELNNFEYNSVEQKTDMKMTDTTSSILVNQSDNIPQWTNLEDKTYQVSSNLDETQTQQPHQYVTETLYDICPVTKMTSISKDIMTSKAGLTQPETKASPEPESNRLPSHSEEVTLGVSTGFDGRSSPIDQTVQPHSDSVTSNLDTEYNEVWTKFYSPLEEDNDWNEKPCLTLKEPSKDNNDTMAYLLKDDSTESEPLENEIEHEDIWKMFYNPISNKDWEEKALKISRDNEIWRKFYETDENTDDYKSLIDRNQYSTDWKYTVSEPLEEDRKDLYIWSKFYSSEDSFKGVGDTKTSERRQDPQVTKVESDKITSGVIDCSSQGTQELLGIHHSEINNITTQLLMNGDESQDPESSGETVHSVDREINTHEILKNENLLDSSENGKNDAATDEKNLEYSALEEDNDWEEKDPSKLQVVEYHQLPVQTFLESWQDTASDPLEDADILTRDVEIPNYDNTNDGKNINTVIYSNIPDINTPTSENVIREVGVSEVMSVQIDNLEYSALEEDNDWEEKGPTLFQVKHKYEEPVETFLESWKDTVSDPLEDADILSTEDQTPDDGKSKDQNVDTKSIDVKKLKSIPTSENIVQESVGDDVTSVRIEPSDYDLEYSALEEDNDWKEKDPTLVQVRTKVEEPEKTFLESWKDTVSDPLEDADILSTEDQTPDDGKSKDQNVGTKSIDVKKLKSISTSENIVQEIVGDDVTSVRIEPSDYDLEYSALEEDNDWKEKDPTLVQVRTKVEEPEKTFLESWKDTVSDPLEDADILSTEDQTPDDGKSKDQNVGTKKSVGDDVTSLRIEPSDYDLEYSALEEDNDWKEKDPTLVQVRTKVEEPEKTFLESWKDTVSDPLEDADILSTEDQTPDDGKSKDQNVDTKSIDVKKLKSIPTSENIVQESVGDDVTSVRIEPSDYDLEYSALEEDNDWKEKDPTLVQVRTKVEEPEKTFLESWKDTVSDPLEDADILSTEDQTPDDGKSKDQNVGTKSIDVKKLKSISTSENIVQESVGDDVTSVRIEPSDYDLEYSALEEDNDWKEKDPTLVQVRTKVEEPEKTFIESWKDTVSDPLEDADIVSTEDQTPDDGKSKDQNVGTKSIDVKKFKSIPTSENIVQESFGDDVTSLRIEPSDYDLEYSALEEDNDWKEKDPTLVQVRTKVEEPAKTFLESWKDTVSDPLEDADILSTEDQTPDDGKPKDQNVGTKSIDVKKFKSIPTSENIVQESVGDDVTSVRIEPSDYDLEYSALEEDNDWKEKDPTLVQVRSKVEEPEKTFSESWKDTASDPLEDADILSTEDQTPDDGKPKDQNVGTKSIDVKKFKSISSSENIVQESVGDDVTSLRIEPSDYDLEYSALEEDNDWKEKDPTLVQVRTKVEEPAKTFIESWKDTVSDPLEDADILSTEDQTPDDGKSKDQNVGTKSIDVKKFKSIPTSENIVQESVGDDVTSLRIEPSDYDLEYSALEEDNDWKEKDPTLVQVRTKVEEPAKTFLESWKDTASDPLEDADILSTEDQTPDDGKPKDQNVDTKNIATNKLECISTSEIIVRESVGDDVTSVRIEPSDYDLEYSALEEDNDWKEKDPTLVPVRTKVEEPAKTFLESWKDTVSDPLEDADILSTDDSVNVMQSRHAEVVAKSSTFPTQRNWDSDDNIYVSVDDIENELGITDRTRDLPSPSHHKDVTDSSEEKATHDETDVWSMFYTPMTPGKEDDDLEYSALEEDNDWEEKDPTLVQVTSVVEEPIQTFLESWKDTASDPLEDADILSTEDQTPDDGKTKHQGLDTKNIATNKLECISTSESIVRESVGDDVTSVRIEPSDYDLEYSALEEDNDWKEKDPTLVQVRTKVEEPAKTFLESWKDTVSDPLEDADILSTEEQTPDDVKTTHQRSASQHKDVTDSSEEKTATTSGDETDVWSMFYTPMTPGEEDDNLEYSALEEDNDWEEKDPTLVQVRTEMKGPVETFLESWKDTVSDPLEDADILNTEDQISGDVKTKHQNIDTKDITMKKLECISTSENIVRKSVGDDVTSVRIEPSDDNLQYSALEEDNDWEEKDPTLVQVRTKGEEPEKTFLESWKDTVSDPLEDADILSTEDQTPDDGKSKDQNVGTKSIDVKKLKSISTSENIVQESVGDDVTSVRIEPSDYNLEYSALEEDNDWKEKDPTLVQVRSKVEEPEKTFLESWKDTASDPLEDADILSTEEQTPDDGKSKDQNVGTKSIDVKKFKSIPTSENIVQESVGDDVTSVRIEPSDYNLEYSALEEDNDWKEKDPTLVQVRSKVEEPEKTFLESWKDTASDPLEDADILSTEEQTPDDVKTTHQHVDTNTSENIVRESVGDDVTSVRIEPSDYDLEYSALEEDNDWQEKGHTLVQVKHPIEGPVQTFMESWKDTVSDPLEDADILSTEDSDNVIQSRHIEVAPKSSAVPCKEEWDTGDSIYVSVDDIENELGVIERTKDLHSASQHRDITDSSEEKTATTSGDETDVWSMFYTPMTPGGEDDNLEYSALEEDEDSDNVIQSRYIEVIPKSSTVPCNDKCDISDDIYVSVDDIENELGIIEGTKDLPSASHHKDVTDSTEAKTTSDETDVWSMFYTPMTPGKEDDDLEYSALEEDNDWEEKDPTLVQVRTKAEEPEKTFLESWKDTSSDPLEDADILSTEDQISDDVKTKHQDVDTKDIATNKLECISTSETIVRESVGDDVTSIRIEPSDDNLQYSALEEDNDWEEKDPSLVQVRTKVEEPVQTFLESWQDTVSDPLEDADILSTENQISGDVETKEFSTSGGKEHSIKHAALEEVSDCEDNVPRDSSVEYHEILEYDSISDSENEENYSPPLQFSADKDCHLTQLSHGFAGKKSLVTKAVNTDDNEVWNMYFTSHQKDSEYAEIEKYPLEDVESVKLRLNSRMDDFSKGSLHSEPSSRETSTSPLSFEQLKETASDIDYSIDHREDFNWELREQIANNLSQQNKSYCYRDQPEFFSGSLDSWASSTGTMFTATPGYMSSTCVSDSENTPLMSNSDDEYLDAKDIFFEDEPHVKVDIPYTYDTQSEVNESITLVLPTDETTKTLNKVEQEKAEALQRKHIIEEEISLLLSEIVAMASEGTKRTEKANLSEQDVKAEGTKISQKITEIIQGMVHSNENMEGKVTKDINAIIPQDASLTEVQDTMGSTEVMDNQETYSDELVVPSETETKYVNLEVTEQMEQKLQNVASLYSNYAEDIPDTQLMLKLETLYFIEKMGKNKDKDNLDTQGNLQSSKFVTSIEPTCDKNIKHQDNQHVDNLKSSEFSELSTDQHRETDQSTEVLSKSSANENEEIFANVLMVELPITEELHVSDEHLDSSESSINRTKENENCRFTSTLELQLPNTGVSDTTKSQNQRSSAKRDGLTSRSKRSKSKLSPGDRIARRWRRKSPHRNYSNALFINVPNYSESSEEEMSKDVEESQLDNEECKMALKHHRLSESGFPIETHSELLKRLSSMESDCSSTSSYEGFRCTLHTFVPDYDMKNYHNIFVIPKRYGTFSTEVNMNIAEPKETNLLDESSPSKKTVKSSVTLANSPEEVLCTIAKSPSEHTTTSDNFESKRKESVEEETTIIVKNTHEEKLSDKGNDRRDSIVIDFTADERRNDRMSYFTEEQIQDMLQKVNQKGSVTQYSKSGYQTDCYSFSKENEFRYGTSNYPSLMNYPSQAEPYWQTKSTDPEKTMLLTYSEMLLSSDIISSKAENAHEIADNDSNIIDDDTEKPTDVLDSTDMEKLRRESQELTQTSEQLAIDLSSLLSVDSSEISNELSQNYVSKRPKSPEDHSESSQETSSSDSDGDYPSNQHLILEFGGENDVSNKCTELPSANISSEETNLQTQSDDVSMKSEDVISETDKAALTEANLSKEIIATVPDSADGKHVHVDNFPEHSEYLSSQATEEISEESSIIEIVEDHTEGPNDKMSDDVSEFVDRKEVFFGTMRQQIDKPLSYSLPVNTSLAESSSSLHDGADCETSKETVSSDVDIFQMKLLNRELCETNELNATQHEELSEPQAKELDNVSVLESVGKEFEFTSASSFEESSVSIPENSLAEKSVPDKDHSEEEIMPVTFDEVKSNFTEETSTKKPEDIFNAEFSETDIGKFSPASNEAELEQQKPLENIQPSSEQFYKECFGNESSYVVTEFPEELRSQEEHKIILSDKHLATFDENQRQETDICRDYSTEKDQFLKETDADTKNTGIKNKKKKKQKKKPRFFALDNEMLMQFVETTAELSKESEFDSSGMDPNIASLDQNDSAVTKNQMEIQSLAELEIEESLKELPPTSLAVEDKFEISEDTLKTQNKINSVTEESHLSHDAHFVDAITEQESSTELLDSEFTPSVIKENANIEEIEQVVNKLVVSPCKEMLTHETEISSIECEVSEITSEPLNDNTLNIKYSEEVGFDSASVQQPEAFVNIADTEPYCQLLKEQTDIGVIEHSSVDQSEKKEEQSKNVDLVKHVEISDVQETFTESSNVNLTAEWDNATQLEIEHRSCLLKTEDSPDQQEIKESTCLLKATEDTALSKTEESTTQMEIKDSSPAQMESETFSKSSPEQIELKTDITEVEQKQLEVKCGESTITASPTFPVQSTVAASNVSIIAPEEEKPKKKRKKRRSPYLYGYGDDSINSSDFIEPMISDPDVSQHILPALAETVSSCTDTTSLKSAESKSSPETIIDKDIDGAPNENQVKEATPEIKDHVSTHEPTDVTCTKCSPEEETEKDIHPKKKKKKKKKSSLKDENETTSEQKKSNQSSKKDKESFSKEKTPDTLCKDGAFKSQEGDGQIPLVKELKDSEATKSQDDYPKTDRQLSSEEELQKEFVVESNEERTDECVYSLLPSETEIDVTTHQASMLEDVKGEMIVENIHKTAQKENKQAKVEQLSRTEDGNNLAFAQEKPHLSAIVKEDLDESDSELELSRKPMLDKHVSKSISSPPEGTGSDKHLLFSEDFKDADFRLAEKSDKKSFVNISESNENVQSEILDETNIVSKDNENSSTSNTKITSLETKKKRRSPFPYGDDEKSILSKGIEEYFQSTPSKATKTGPLYVDSPAMTSELKVAETPDLTISNQSFSNSEELKYSQVMTTPEDTKKKKKQKKTSQVKFSESGKVIPVPPESSSVETSAKISVVEDNNTVEIKKGVSKTENKVSQTLSKVSSAISKKAQAVLEDSPIRKKKSSTSNEESSEDSKTNENNSSILKLSKKKTKHKEVSTKENSSELCPSKESKNISTDSSSITSSEHSQKKFIAETEKLVKLEPVEEKTTHMSIAPPISKIPSETDSKCPNKENKEKEESSTGKVAKSVVDKISSLVTSITKQVTDSLEELSTHKKKKLKQSSLTIPELKETEDKRSFKERTESSNSDSKNKSNKKVLDSSLSEKSMRKVGEANPNSKQKSQKGNSSSKASPLLSKKKQKSKHSRDSKNIPVSLIKIESPYRQHTYLPLIHHLTEEEAAFSDTTPLTKRKKRQRKKKKHHNLSQLSTATESSCEIDTALWLHSNKSSRDNSSHQKTKIPPRPKIVVSEDTSAPPLPLPRANSTPPTKRAGTPTSPYLSADSFNNPRSRSRCRRSPVKELLWLSEQEMLSDRNDSDSTRRGRSLSNIHRISKINLAYISTGTRVRKRRKKNIIAVS
ncbi:uncharacterized protein LOC115219318 [Octopus sinensis]|uniref:Uncharacterized protein LOC115219318 n=1 Tax=Octopus sinensis TaxID=2607531 RepID=A0A7E6FEF0_9MOLL|nr:uncharacterized protein LOC115219318 [Octopus sinensis]